MTTDATVGRLTTADTLIHITRRAARWDFSPATPANPHHELN